jgi:hypothetical protein
MVRPFSHVAAVIVSVLVCAGTVHAQDRNAQDRNRSADSKQADNQSRFNDHDRQAAGDWQKQHQAHPVIGFRAQDRLSADFEGLLTVGSILDVKLRSREHPVPADLRRELSPAPRNCRYVVIGGHVVLLDNRNHVLDVIHLH